MEFAITRRNVPISLSPEKELKVKIRAANDTIKTALKIKSTLPNRRELGLSMIDSLVVRKSPDLAVVILSGIKGLTPEAKMLMTDGSLKACASVCGSTPLP